MPDARPLLPPPRAQVVTLQLENTRGVPCEWSTRRPVDAAKSADWDYFVCEPPEGTLAPGEKAKVKVSVRWQPAGLPARWRLVECVGCCA